MSNVFNNGESLFDIRTRINNNTLTVEETLTTKPYEYTAGADNASGPVSSQTSNSVTDGIANYITDQWIDYVVELTTVAGEVDYAVVLSNTQTKLTFDDDHAGYTFASYRIMSTFEVEDMTSLISFDVRTNEAALILPDVSSINNRDYTRIYLELSNNDKGLIIICRGLQRQRGLKWGKLIYKYELVELTAHQTVVPHWDILELENIKRYGSIETNINLPVNTVTYAEILTAGSVDLLPQSKRFDLVSDGGVDWLRYQSIIQQDFRLSGSIPINRTGGGTSSVEVKVRIKRFSTGLDEDSTSTIIAQFGNDDTKTVPVDISFTLDPYDQITLIAERDTGTVTILSGASFIFTEM